MLGYFVTSSEVLKNEKDYLAFERTPTVFSVNKGDDSNPGHQQSWWHRRK